ncbi:MAG: fibronectin type III domain-containing protein [Deltaproteobacteria bacterium]|nr:fibronectin type III domain-containing protein [Deltaproteobacteria bacterium]
MLVIPVTLFASSLRISWNANIETDLDGYRIYYGHLSGSYEYVLDVGNTVCVDIDGVEEDTVYFFAVTAYDFAGNESIYSHEVSVLIPQEQTSFLGVVINWFFNIVSGAVSNDPDAPRFYLDDFSTVNDYISVNSTSLVQINDSTVDPEDAASQAQDAYVIRDVLLETDAVLDLSELYPVGSYIFVALTQNAPEIVDNSIYGYESGSLLYMVADTSGNFIDVLRVSIVDELCYAAEFLPGSDIAFEVLADGISLIIPQDALNGSIPIGIGCEGIVQSGSAVQSFDKTNVLMFDVVPYGLVLLTPAQISAAYDTDYSVVVEVYDEVQKKWIGVEDVQENDGMVTFSTLVLGSFRVYSAASDVEGALPDAFTYESSAGGGCFVAVVDDVPSRRYQVIVSILLAVLAISSSFRYLFPDSMV